MADELRAPRTDLIRMSRAVPGIKDGRTLFGFPVAYSSPAEVRSWEGHFVEQMMPGAAAKTISEWNEWLQRFIGIFCFKVDGKWNEVTLQCELHHVSNYFTCTVLRFTSACTQVRRCDNVAQGKQR